MKEAIQFVLDEDQSNRLTDWEKEPTLLTLKADLLMAQPSHDAWIMKIRKWNDLTTVTGTSAQPKVKGRSSVQPKLIRRQAEWRYSALTEPFLGSNKLFKVSPVTWEDADAAKQNELVLNWQFRTKLNKVKFIDDYVRCTVDEGTSVLRLGWERYTAPITTHVPVWEHQELTTADQAQQLQAAIQLKLENPHEYSNLDPALQAAVDYFEESGQGTLAVQRGTQSVASEKVICNRPTVEVINPQNFYLDPTCNGDPEKALFNVVSFETNQAELKKQPKRYKNLDKVNWETATPITQPDHATSINDAMQFKDILRKRVVAYEWWGLYDIHNTGVLVPIVVTWIGLTIIRMELNPFPDQKPPFIIVPYLPVKREAMGEPDAELLEDNQKVLGAVTRGMIDLLGRSANSQRGIAKGMLDPLNKRRYEAGDDYEFNPSQNPTNNIIEHKYPELPQSAMVMLNLQNAEAEALTGVKSFAGGISGDSYGQVAAGVRPVTDAASKREMAILRRLAHGMTGVGQKLISMNAVFLSDKEVIRVTNAPFVNESPRQDQDGDAPRDHTGDPGEKAEASSQSPYDASDPDSTVQFVTVNREDLVGDFDLEVDISTAEVDDSKAKDMGFMLQTMGPDMDPDIKHMILADIADLKRMPALAHKIRTWKPPVDPMAEQMKQLALQKAQKEVEEIQSNIDLNEAKAKQAGAVADKANLDYVEQETGTHHARRMDEQAGQARGNQALAVTKALVSTRKPDETKPNIAAAVGFNALTESKDEQNTVDTPPQPVDTSVQPSAVAT